MPSPALNTSDLIFPTQSLNLNTTLHSLKRSALSVHNRLSSIVLDSRFACSVADAYALPLVANERCGSWYIPPERKGGSAYFKSTDGHMNEWSFSMRRLNLHFLDVVAKGNGAVVVDSTRRGKSMPDALSKTIPIWCCVLNRAIFPDLGPHSLYTPPQAVSPSEHSQIEKRIEGFVKQFKETYTNPLSEIRTKLQKPLRPIWVTPESSLPGSPPSFPDFHPIVLCTASRRVRGGEVSEGGYIQGAADDHEAWAAGLTPSLFWTHKDELLNTNEEEIPSLIASLVAEHTDPASVAVRLAPSNLYVCATQDIVLDNYAAVITCGDKPLPPFPSPAPLDTWKKPKGLHLQTRAGKLGSRDLRDRLPDLPAFLSSLSLGPGSKILITCPTGKDLSLGVALAILCLYTSDDGALHNTPVGNKVDKNFIRQRLTWLSSANPAFNPSRETLKAVNAWLMPDPSSSSSPTSNSVSTPAPTVATPAPPSISPPTPKSEPENSKKPTLQAQIFTSLLPPPNNPKPWKLTRTLTSTLPTHPSGTVTGTATFISCPPGSDQYSAAYLYSEEGEFVTDNGLKFNARRRYVYRLKKAEGAQNTAGKEEEEISIHFFDDETALPTPKTSTSASTSTSFQNPSFCPISPSGAGIGSLFVEMGPLSFESTWSGTLSAQNKERHLCGGDLYGASWRFGAGMFENVRSEKEDGRENNGVEGEWKGGDEGKWWEVKYDVKGPKKDYVSWTRYEM